MDYEKQLLQMLRTQIVARGIHNPKILEAMQRVPRHLFVPKGAEDQAYADHPVLLSEERATISQPYMVAYMTNALDCQPSDQVLEIGTGSGYQAAILAQVCRDIYTIERYSSLTQIAQANMDRLGITNVHFLTGDGLHGWPEASPFDKIILTAALKKTPRVLFEQLREGGMCLVPLGEPGVQTLTRIRKIKGGSVFEKLMQCVFVPLISQSRDMTQSDIENPIEPGQP